MNQKEKFNYRLTIKNKKIKGNKITVNKNKFQIK